MPNKKKVTKISENLKRFKENKHLSQSGLCEITGLAYHTIAKIEAGATPDPRISTLKKIAKALGVSIDVLVGGNE